MRTQPGEVRFNPSFRQICTFRLLSEAAFAIIPVPILFIVAALTMYFGTDHPNGKWADRHKMNTSPSAVEVGGDADDIEGGSEKGKEDDIQDREKVAIDVDVHEIDSASKAPVHDGLPLSWKLAWGVVINPLTWLPALAYLSESIALPSRDEPHSVVQHHLGMSSQSTRTSPTCYLGCIRRMALAKHVAAT